ncbi:Hypothetical predicted protein, partial [Pelobates cultripes]
PRRLAEGIGKEEVPKQSTSQTHQVLTAAEADLTETHQKQGKWGRGPPGMRQNRDGHPTTCGQSRDGKIRLRQRAAPHGRRLNLHMLTQVQRAGRREVMAALRHGDTIHRPSKHPPRTYSSYI